MVLIKRLQYNAPVILTYSILSLLACILGYMTKGNTTLWLFSVYRGNLGDPLFYFRLFGHVLGHVDFAHYYNNFLIILLVGPMLEEKYGSRTMLWMILITAFVTGILNVLLTNNMLLGASGIVFMLIVLSSFVNLQAGRIPLTLLLVIGIFIGKEFVSGVFYEDNISHMTHIIGGLCGALLGYGLNKNKFHRSRK